MWTIGGVTFNYICTSNTTCMRDDLSSFGVLNKAKHFTPVLLLSRFSSSVANARGRVMMWRWLFNKWTMHKESTVDHYFNRTTLGLNSNLFSQSTQPASPSSDLLTNSEYLNRLKSLFFKSLAAACPLRVDLKVCVVGGSFVELPAAHSGVRRHLFELSHDITAHSHVL